MRRTLCAALIPFLAGPALCHAVSDSPRSTDSAPIVRTALELADAARNLPSEGRIQSTRAALSIVLLSRFNRLLPTGLDPASIDELARVFLTTSDANRQNAIASRLPPADSLVFDGSRLSGGNFRNIDSLLGMDGRPIALHRELPVWIVPLTPSAAAALQMQREEFAGSPAGASAAELANRIYLGDVGGNLAADGIFLRPYAGRIDDLYHHLAQQGGDASGLDYYAILDSLPPRQYSPVSGTASRSAVPPIRFHLSDVLTGGGFFAVQKFRSENPKASLRNPFKGLAAKLLPYLGKSLEDTEPGSSLRIPGETMRRAITDPRRFTPGKVPSLFNDPSRFLGLWMNPQFEWVSKKKKPSASARLLEEIQKIDFETPLPEMNLEPAGNELLGGALPPESSEPPGEIAEENNADLIRDLGLPEPTPTPTQQVSLPPPQPEPTPPIFTADFKPSPPALELEMPSSSAPEPLLMADASPSPTPEPAGVPTPEPTVTETPEVEVVDLPRETPSSASSPVIQELAVATPFPTPKLIQPSAVALVEEKDRMPMPSPTPPREPVPTPAEPVKVAKAIPVTPPADSALSLIQEAESRSHSTGNSNRFQVAALVPTNTQAVEYLKSIAASDVALADNMAEFNRIECYIRWLGEAVKPFEPEVSRNPESTETKSIEETLGRALDELVALKTRRDELKAARIKELEARQAIRTALEREIRSTRRDELTRLTGVGA